MLTEIYIEALLVDDDLADQVWEVWDAGEIDDLLLRLSVPASGPEQTFALEVSPGLAPCSVWGRSSAGRASRSQCEGREFDPPWLHKLN